MMRTDEGLPKMWTIHKALELRRERPDWFGAEAEYTPLEVDGAKHDHVIAYLRGEDVVTVVPRLTVKLDGSWKDTIVVLPKGRWRNRLTGGRCGGWRDYDEGVAEGFSGGAAGARGCRGLARAMHEFTVWAPNAREGCGEDWRCDVSDASGRMSAGGGVLRWSRLGRELTMGLWWMMIRRRTLILVRNGSRMECMELSRVYDQKAFAWSDGGWQAPAACAGRDL